MEDGVVAVIETFVCEGGSHVEACFSCWWVPHLSGRHTHTHPHTHTHLEKGMAGSSTIGNRNGTTHKSIIGSFLTPQRGETVFNRCKQQPSRPPFRNISTPKTYPSQLLHTKNQCLFKTYNDGQTTTTQYSNSSPNTRIHRSTPIQTSQGPSHHHHHRFLVTKLRSWRTVCHFTRNMLSERVESLPSLLM